MLQRLESNGLVTHEPYDGATLTADGRDTAEDLHKTYVTLSQFFREVLDPEDYETEAMELVGNIVSGKTIYSKLVATASGSSQQDLRRETARSPRQCRRKETDTTAFSGNSVQERSFAD